MIGRWRVIPGRTADNRRYWSVGRDEAGGIRFILTDYSRVPRRWKNEQKARDYCAVTLRLQRETDRAERAAARLAAERAHLPPNWPFPVSGHNWKEPQHATGQ